MSFTNDELLRALDEKFSDDFEPEDAREEMKSEYYTPGSLVSWSELGWQGERGNASVEVNGVQYPVLTVAETGGMDAGSDASYVFKIADRYFKKEGFYQSHYGYDWDGDFFEVEAFEKTVTDYRQV